MREVTLSWMVAAMLALGSAGLRAQDVCYPAARIKSGAGVNGVYATIVPVDAGGQERNYASPLTCGGAELERLGDYTNVESAKNLRGIEAAITAKRGEIVLLTFNQVSCFLINTLRPRWSLPLPSQPGDGWAANGGLLLHANGTLYAVLGRVLLAIDPVAGELKQVSLLPAPAEGFTVCYDGVMALPDGQLLVKSLVQQRNGAASQLHILHPETLEVLQTLDLPERIQPRLMVSTVRRQTYVYATGASLLHRLRYREGRLEADAVWGEMAYLRGNRTPGGSAAAMAEWVVVQSNRSLGGEPLVLSAILAVDPKQRFRFPPFGEDPAKAWSALPLCTDGENRRVYTISSGLNQLVALDFDPASGFGLAWAITAEFAAPPVLLGPPEDRLLLTTEVVADETDATLRNEYLVWRRAKTGEELRRSEPLVLGAGFAPVPNFGATFFHLAPKQGYLTRVEFTHQAPPGIFGKPKQGAKKK